MRESDGRRADGETAKDVVQRFWRAMQSNDFVAASQLLAIDYELEWPQSGERVRGRDDFAGLNANYPAAGPWRFAVTRLVADGEQVVSDVLVTDGATHARAITFSIVRDGLIASQLEFWPDPFAAPAWRARWVNR